MAVLLAAAGAALLYSAASFTVFRYMSCREKGILSRFLDKGLGDPIKEESRNRIREGREWLKARPYRDVYIDSFDSLRLHAYYFENPSAERITVCCHGYRSSGFNDTAPVARGIYESGSSILLIDQRACGASEGRYITYGVREGRDAADWARSAEELTGGMLPVYLYGLSLGSSSVMAAFNHELPGNLAGVIADCGFTSPYDIIGDVMEKMTGRLSRIILMPGLRAWARLAGGFGMKAPCAREGVAMITVPFLLVHGKKDGFVPFSMGEELFALCPSENKRMLVCEDAAHAESSVADGEKYMQEIKYIFNIQEDQ